jgi:Sec-independent protein translocase protein TatA
MGDLSIGHIFLIVIVAILIYGKDLPQAARKLANFYVKLRRQLTDIREEIQRQIPLDELREGINLDNPSYPSTPQVDVPPTPMGLTATAHGTDVMLTWSSSPGATSYTIKRSLGNADPFLILAMNVSELYYTDSGATAGTTYHYAISASNTAGESANSDEAMVVIPGGPGVTAPEAGLAAPAASSEIPLAAPSGGNGGAPHPPPPSPASVPETRPADGADTASGHGPAAPTSA